MSNDPYSQHVPLTKQKDNSFPSHTMGTVVGNVKVQDKSYDVQGALVDSTGDTPIDVNALMHAQAPKGGLPSTGIQTIVDTPGHKSGSSSSGGTQVNPGQSFLQ